MRPVQAHLYFYSGHFYHWYVNVFWDRGSGHASLMPSPCLPISDIRVWIRQTKTKQQRKIQNRRDEKTNRNTRACVWVWKLRAPIESTMSSSWWWDFPFKMICWTSPFTSMLWPWTLSCCCCLCCQSVKNASHKFEKHTQTYEYHANDTTTLFALY